MQVQYIKQVGTISNIKEPIVVRRKNKPDICKINFTFTSVDGQVHYPEIRNEKTSFLDYIKEGELTTIEFFLQGSEKNDKQYNNVVCHSITKF